MPARGFDESTARVVATSEGRVAWIEAGPPAGASPETPPLVLIHGFTGHRDDFVGVLEPLSKLGAGRRVIVPDLRGHGDSDASPGTLGWCFEQLVNDLEAFLDHLGLDRIDLLGHSMGGFVALRFALAHPERLRSLVFLCTGPEVPTELVKESFMKAAAIAGDRGMAGLQALLEKVGRAETSPLVAARAEDYWRHHARRFDAMTPASYRGFGFALFESPSLVKRLSEIEQPTLVLVGEHDLEWLPGAGLFEANLPDVHRDTLPDAGHHPHNENPQAFLSAMERHLVGLDTASPEAHEVPSAERANERKPT
jgi:pimeloyl-ACP methyl ester carboxylesterase